MVNLGDMKEAMQFLLPRVGDRIRYIKAMIPEIVMGAAYTSYVKPNHDYVIDHIYAYNGNDPFQKMTKFSKLHVVEVPKRNGSNEDDLFVGDVYFDGFYPVHARRAFPVPGTAKSVFKHKDGDFSIDPLEYQVQSMFILPMPYLPEPQKRDGYIEPYNMIFLSES